MRFSDFLVRAQLLMQKLLKQATLLLSYLYKNYTVVITIWLAVTQYPYLNGNGSFTF